jgi:hypothetical protein
VGEGNSCRNGRKRASQRTRRIPLDDHEIGSAFEYWKHGFEHRVDVPVGLVLSRAMEINSGQAIETARGKIQVRVLTG